MAEEMDVSTTNEAESDVVTLTLNEVLELEDELIEHTAAVLGAASDKTCSYVEGYMKRQALYSCLTCIPEAKDDPMKGAGVCLACSYHCHEGHELIELYTKRNFRCDCGNTKFPNGKCNLLQDKSDLNGLNQYNQNFSGSYCVCHRPYPDVDDPIPDQMVQCIVCEDWYHERHLGTAVPSSNFAEMICEACVSKHEFLLHYDSYCVNPIERTVEEKTVDVTSNDTNSKSESDNNESGESEEPSGCKKPKQKSPKISAKFWREDTWRKELCTCDDCLKMYEGEDIAFLLDPEDPVCLYEEKGKAKAKEVIETEDRKLMNSMDRVQLIEVISGYNDLKENLSQYLKKFEESKKVIREEDIREFFEGMAARKKQKVEVPHFCR